MTVRTKRYNLKSGEDRQIKIIDIEAPIRFLVVSGTFTYDHKIEDQDISTATAIASGVVTAPGGAWGSEVKINCTGDGLLMISYMG